MHSARLLLLGVTVAVVSLMLPERPVAETSGAEQPVGNADADLFRPVWSVGDTWFVETQTRALQNAGESESRGTSPPLRWQFTVHGLE